MRSIMKGRIVHITLSMNPGGIENLILDLAANVNRSRFSLSIGCLDAAGAWFDRVRELRCSGFVFHRRPGFDVRLLFKLYKRFKQYPCDLIHTHNQAAHFYGGLAAKLAGVPCLVTTEHSRHYIDERYRRRIEKRLLAQITDRWVTVSDELASLSTARDGIAFEKLSVINNGIDIPRFSRPHKREIGDKSQRMKMALGIAPEEKVVIAIGRLHPVKNHMLLFEAAAILINLTGSPIHVLLAGDGPLREDLHRRAAELGIERWVHFLGMRKDIPELLWMSDVFVLCSHTEGLPLSLLESWAAGIPVVITRSANRAAMVEDEITGKVVDTDVQALCEGLGSVLAKPEKCRIWVQNGLRQVRKEFSVQAMTCRYEQLYQIVLKEKGISITTN